MKRRTFIGNSALIGAGTALPPGEVFGKSGQSKLSARLAGVNPLAGKFMVTGPGVTGAGPRLTVVAEVSDYSAMTGSLGAEVVRAAGSKLSFWRDGVHVTVENLPKDAFTQRVKEIGSGNYGKFCHDSVMVRTREEGLSDPHGVYGSGIPCVEPVSSLTALPVPEAFLGVLEGMMARVGGLSSSPAFADQQEEILNRSPRHAGEAREVVTALLQQVVGLTGALSDGELQELFGSHLVAASFLLSDGRSTQRMLQALRLLRAAHGQADPAELWLALVLGAGARATAAPSLATGSSDPYAADSTRVALPAALAILDGTSISVPSEGSGLAVQDFADWQAAYLPAAVRSAQTDLDQDGLPALVEYGLGLDPEQFSHHGAPVIGEESEEGERYLTLSYARDLTKTDLHYQVETSTTLTDGAWTRKGVIDEPSGTGASPAVHYRKARVLRDHPRRFLRLRITKVR